MKGKERRGEERGKDKGEGERRGEMGEEGKGDWSGKGKMEKGEVRREKGEVRREGPGHFIGFLAFAPSYGGRRMTSLKTTLRGSPAAGHWWSMMYLMKSELLAKNSIRYHRYHRYNQYNQYNRYNHRTYISNEYTSGKGGTLRHLEPCKGIPSRIVRKSRCGP